MNYPIDIPDRDSIDLKKFDFSLIIPDCELDKHNAQNWFNTKFKKLKITDHDLKRDLVEILHKTGSIKLSVDEIYPLYDPRHDEDGKFYHWDECWVDLHGPFDTAEQRDKALHDYDRHLHNI